MKQPKQMTHDKAVEVFKARSSYAGNVSLRENIDAEIKSHQLEIAKLVALKAEFPAELLSCSVTELQTILVKSLG